MASVPSKKHFSDIQHLPSYNTRLPILAELLTTLCAKNDKVGTAGKLPIFSAAKPAMVSVKDYLVRMCKYGHCSPTVFICMAVYVDRLCDKTGIELTSSNIHRILIGAFLISAKLHDDVYYSNKYYASIGGLSLKETNQLEASFLEQTDWDMYVSEDEYRMYMEDLKVVTPPPPGSGHVAGTPVNALRYRRASAAAPSGKDPIIVGPSLRPPTKPIVRPSGRRHSSLSTLQPEEESSSRRTSTDSCESQSSGEQKVTIALNALSGIAGSPTRSAAVAVATKVTPVTSLGVVGTAAKSCTKS